MATKMTKVSEPTNETAKKTYDKSDVIPCRSITNGGLYIDGVRSKMFYQWADYGDVVDVEYQDLIFMINSRDANITTPRFIIEDDELVSNHKYISDIYNSLYSLKDFGDIVRLPISDMINAISEMPESVKKSFKGYVSTMIDNGTLDSVKKIKAIDDIFNTKLLYTMSQE